MAIDGDLAGLAVVRDTGVIEAQAVGVRTPTHRHQDLVALEDQRLAVLRLRADGRPGGGQLRPGDFGFEMEFHPLLHEHLLHGRRDFAIADGQDPRQILKHRHLRPEPFPDAAQLEADIAAADDDEMLGHAVEMEGVGTADDRLAVELEERQLDRLAARGEEDRRGGQGRCRAVRRGDDDLPVLRQLAGAVGGGDLVFPEQEGDAVGQPFDDFILPFEHGADMERQAGRLDAVLGEFVLGEIPEFGGIEQRLAGDAADIEAGAPQGFGGPLLDNSHFLSELRRPDRRDVPTRPRADNNQIECIRHDRPR